MKTARCPWCFALVGVEPIVGSTVRVRDHEVGSGRRCGYSGRRLVLSEEDAS